MLRFMARRMTDMIMLQFQDAETDGTQHGKYGDRQKQQMDFVLLDN